MRRGISLLLLAGLAPGCANQLDLHPVVATTPTADIDRALTKAVTEVDAAVDQLHNDPYGTVRARPGYVPVELRRPFNVDLAGVPLAQAAAALADAAGYRLENPGQIQGPVVTLRAVDTPIIDLFRTLGHQGGSTVRVAVDGDTHTVQITQPVSAPHA